MAIRAVTLYYDEHHESSVQQMMLIARENWSILAIERDGLPEVEYAKHPFKGCTDCRPELVNFENRNGRHHGQGNGIAESESAEGGGLLRDYFSSSNPPNIQRQNYGLREHLRVFTHGKSSSDESS